METSGRGPNTPHTPPAPELAVGRWWQVGNDRVGNQPIGGGLSLHDLQVFM